MNYGRLALAALAAWLVDVVYGFLVYAKLLHSEFGRYPAIYRSDETGMAFMPVLFLGVLIAMFVASYMYAKGYEGGSGMEEGMRFGVLVGLLMVGYNAIVSYAVMNIGRKLAGSLALASLVEWTIAGTVIGAVYKSAATPARTARV